MPSDDATADASASPPVPTPPPTAIGATGYRALLRNREFAGLYAGFTLTVAAGTLSGFALGTLVDDRTGSPFLTAVSMYGATFATVLGALTLMSVADGKRPRRILVTLQCVSLAGVAAQAVPGLPLTARFGLLLVLGFFHSLGTGARMGLLAEVVPSSAYALARSLMNITSGGTAVLGFAAGALLLRYLSPHEVFVVAAVLTGLGLVAVATTAREHSTRPAGPGRPGTRSDARPGPLSGLRRTWATNTELFSHPGRRALLLNLWVPNGLVVGCEALFISYDPEHAGVLLAASSAGMLLGDLTVGRLLTADRRRRCAFALRLLLAVPYLLFAAHPPTMVAAVAVFVAGAGFAATLPLQEQLLALTPDPVRGQVQGVESAGRMTWQGIGAALAGGVALHFGPGPTITALAALSATVTLLSRPFAARAK
ncbi:MFS transporter [Streptomyces sp. MAR25Y5]|uniref:MFS transporter n=1 Tax=Streptomyces sp. MAR25Y5 TaxID=2962028 RepID=UPI0020B6609A|nr:MFS transporter [Streptomyces sp. MAR25Y5]MCP3765264.1 MFS transporter [Streptomyces sp. MAR25Y5]